MLKIGFADWYLDNWHCNYFPGFLRDMIEKRGLDAAVTHAYGMHPAPSGMTNADWCREHGTVECASMEELVSEVDAIMVIAADDVMTHEETARIPLSSGKPCFVDKTFAPDLAAAKRMAEIARKYHTPWFSSSAQRYCQDVIDYKAAHPEKPLYVSTVGPHTLDNYAVHQLEVIEALMGPGIRRLKAFAPGEAVTQLILDYGDGRMAGFNQTPQPWAEFNFMVTGSGRGTDGARLKSEEGSFYPNFASAVLDFFLTGIPAVPHEETFEIVSVIETSRRARLSPDEWFDVPV